MNPGVIAGFRSTQQFDADVRAAPANIVAESAQALKLLLVNPRANSLRLHTLHGYAKPTIFKIDVCPNRSWQITFELDGSTAVLLRLAEHRKIDRRPR